MTVKPTLAGLAALLCLGACGVEIQNETYSTVSTFDDTYDVRTRNLLRADGSSYQSSAVEVRGYWYPCLIDSPGDCKAAAERGEATLNDRGFGEN